MYCRECGHELSDQVIDGRVRHVCPGCGYIDWDNWINAAVVVVPYNPQGEFLMVRLGGAEDGSLTCPGGFRELGETLPEAARRETLEETGHAVVDLELFKVYTWDAKRLL
jgi:8-oxo-dGTP diphosphatase